jgi:hypothetical protein
MASATYLGFDESPLTLVEGHWEGQPAFEEATSVPRVDLATAFGITGDLNGDGTDEAVALLHYSFGGSGVFSYLAVVGRDEEGQAESLATTELGDRVQLRSAIVDGGKLAIETIEASADDLPCCPGQKLRKTFRLESGKLQLDSQENLGRLTLAIGVPYRGSVRDFCGDGRSGNVRYARVMSTCPFIRTIPKSTRAMQRPRRLSADSSSFSPSYRSRPPVWYQEALGCTADTSKSLRQALLTG